MWLATTRGFFSVAETARDPNIIKVRARRKKHLADLLSYVMEPWEAEVAIKEIHSDKSNDYEFRYFVDKERFARWMKKIGEGIDYSNFKHEAEMNEDADTEYIDLLHDIWHRAFHALGNNYKEYIGETRIL